MKILLWDYTDMGGWLVGGEEYGVVILFLLTVSKDLLFKLSIILWKQVVS
jgi:hypothetical protein